MSPSTGWNRFGKLCFLVAVATLGSIGVNSDKDLCNQWKSGEVAILTMGDAGNDTFLVMDINFNGFRIPFSKFINHDGVGTPSLDLTEEKPFHLDSVKSIPKPANGKGFFVFRNEMGYPNEFVDPLLAFIWPDLKTITLVPLDGGQERSFIFANVAPSNTLLAGRKLVYFLTDFGQGQFKLRPKEVWISKKYGIGVENSLNYNVTVSGNATIDGGYVYDIGQFVGFAICNQHQTVYLLKETMRPVLYKDFFRCMPEESNVTINATGVGVIAARVGVIAAVVGVIALVLVAVGFGFIMLSKGNKVADKSLDKGKVKGGLKQNKVGPGAKSKTKPSNTIATTDSKRSLKTQMSTKPSNTIATIGSKHCAKSPAGKSVFSKTGSKVRSKA